MHGPLPSPSPLPGHGGGPAPLQLLTAKSIAGERLNPGAARIPCLGTTCLNLVPLSSREDIQGHSPAWRVGEMLVLGV